MTDNARHLSILSVLTPTWNRASYLPRVWSGLSAQTFRDFEWIVADDGSNDDTKQVVRELAAKSDFPVLYLKAEARVGKARMDNEAIRRARGELTLWCDSDDVLKPNAIARLIEVWKSIGYDERKEFVGISALATTMSGIIENPFPAVDHIDVSWNDLMMKHGVKADMVWAARTEALKAVPFPEVDLVIPESAVWSVIGHKRARLVPEVLLFKEYRTSNAISFSGKMSYNRGRAHALAITRREFRGYQMSLKARAWRMISFLRYCWHGEIRFVAAKTLWGDKSQALALIAALPFAMILVLKDRYQNKVVFTHREFQLNQACSVAAEPLAVRSLQPNHD